MEDISSVGYNTKHGAPREIEVPTFMVMDLLEMYEMFLDDCVACGRVDEAESVREDVNRVKLLLEERGVLELHRGV